MALVKGGGDRLVWEGVGCVPDATFKTEIDALIAAGTKVIGKLVAITWSNAYEVTSPAAAADVDGKIIDYEKTASSYRLTVRFFHYVDQNSQDFCPVYIINLPYEGTVALQDSVEAYNSDYDSVTDGGAAGFGACIAVDVPVSGRADFIF